MTGRYLTELAGWLRDAGLRVVEYGAWQTTARAAGGYSNGAPWGVMWHHTASSTSPENDAAYIVSGSDIAPISNLLAARDGVMWVLAAGSTNTNGAGGPWSGWSSGTVEADCMNAYAVSIEIANAGTGEEYPQAQLDACFAASNAITAALGLDAGDVCTHAAWAPGRKIDPATAAACCGPWQPGAVNSSGTWSLDDLVAECRRRAGASSPTPPTIGDDMAALAYYRDDRADGWQIWVVSTDARGNVWTCPITDLPDHGKWDAVQPIVGDPPVRPLGALCGLMDRQNRPGA